MGLTIEGVKVIKTGCEINQETPKCNRLHCRLALIVPIPCAQFYQSIFFENASVVALVRTGGSHGMGCNPILI